MKYPVIDIAEKMREGVITSFNPDAPFPREFQIDITDRCNQRCNFCSNWKLAKAREMESALVCRVLDEAYQFGSRIVGIYGTGEPFMSKNLALYVAHAHECGYEYTYIDTNGALATIDRAGPAIDAGLGSLKFSINAGTRESYREVHGRDDFEAVIKNLANIAEYRRQTGAKTRIYVSMVVTDRVKDEIELLRVLVEPHVDKWYPRRLFNCCGNNPENASLGELEAYNIRGRIKSDRCFQPFKGFMITPEGYMAACVLDYQRALVFADINTMTLKEAWESPVARRFRERHSVGDTDGMICYNCIRNTDEPVVPLTLQYYRPFNSSSDPAFANSSGVIEQA
ncbi:MAG: radical SAM protein [Proteobacteria bacterium]|nr:radical SAM protein [Pseudomonadota bacterium]